MMVGFLATPIFALASDFCRFWQEIYKWQRESEKSLVSCFVSPPKIGIYSPKFELRVELHTVVRLWHVPFAEIQIVSQNDAHTLHNSRPTDSHHDDPNQLVTKLMLLPVPEQLLMMLKSKISSKDREREFWALEKLSFFCSKLILTFSNAKRSSSWSFKWAFALRWWCRNKMEFLSTTENPFWYTFMKH